MLNKIKEINIRLKWAMKEKGVSKLRLSRSLGISQQTMATWVNCTSHIKSNFLIPICNALDIQPLWLLSGEGNMKKDTNQYNKYTNFEILLIELFRRQGPTLQQSVMNILVKMEN